MWIEASQIIDFRCTGELQERIRKESFLVRQVSGSSERIRKKDEK